MMEDKLTMAKCGCGFDTNNSIPPHHPCSEAMMLLDELPSGEFLIARAYANHMKEALRVLIHARD